MSIIYDIILVPIPLMYISYRLMAAQLRKESMVHKLLRCEANIGIKNKRNETPIAFITPSAMEEFLGPIFL